MMLMMLAHMACIISIIGGRFHQFGGIRLQPLCFFRVFYDGFWMAPGGVKLKLTTSGPNPCPEPWVWARCGQVWKQPKMTSSGPNPGSGPENLGLSQMLSFWVFWEGTQENMLPALPAPGRSPLNNVSTHAGISTRAEILTAAGLCLGALLLRA